jgi:hypothetical protein
LNLGEIRIGCIADGGSRPTRGATFITAEKIRSPASLLYVSGDVSTAAMVSAVLPDLLVLAAAQWE